MDKKGEILKTIIVFLFLLFGCSNKYVDINRVSIHGGVVDKWEELGCGIMEQDEKGFFLSFWIDDMVVVGDSIKAEEFVKREDGRKADILVALGMAIIYSGGLGSCYYVKSQDYFTDEVLETGCFISSVSCLSGLAMIVWGGNSRSSDIKSRRDFIKGDTVCVDSESLSKKKIKISIDGSDLEKSYYTDKSGNVKLSFEEIIPEPTVADSIIGLIIKYEEMVDTVNVRRL